MPLSDDEQRILRQIEEQLQEDQRFAQLASPAGLYRQSAKTVRWAGLGVVAGLVLTVVTLQIHFLLAFCGFLVMLGCALVIERQLRAIGTEVALCEGGPTLNAQLLADDLIDEWCQTVAPIVASGATARGTTGSEPGVVQSLGLSRVVVDDDGMLLLRYARES